MLLVSTGRAADSGDYMVFRLPMWSESTCVVVRGYANCEPRPVPESADGLQGARSYSLRCVSAPAAVFSCYGAAKQAYFGPTIKSAQAHTASELPVALAAKGCFANSAPGPGSESAAICPPAWRGRLRLAVTGSGTHDCQCRSLAHGRVRVRRPAGLSLLRRPPGTARSALRSGQDGCSASGSPGLAMRAKRA
jgi:hypothetical protein